MRIRPGFAIVAVALLLVSACSQPAPDTAPPDNAGSTGTQAAPEIDPLEYATRRENILSALPNGILLLHARGAPKEMEQWGFVQDPSFFYFTGLSDLPGAILALDGPRGEARLFVPPPPMSFGFAVEGVVPEPGPAVASELGLDAVVSWDTFAEWVEGRLGEGVGRLYVDEPRRPEARGVPDGFSAVSGPFGLWQAALERRFPRASIDGANQAILTLRWKKSPAEIEVLRANAEMTASALQALARQLRPGLRQREAESTVVATCLAQGGQGPSFWPWVMSGPNARIGGLVSAFFRYEQLDREMLAGELVRVDIGCAGGFFGADVGRTLPVSGSFSAGQREAWDLLVLGYQAGLDVMAPGVSLDSVRDASTAAVEAASAGLETAMGREAAAAIVTGGRGVWHIHGVGVESGEDAGPTFEVGSVLAYEPGFEVGADAFYLEDMIAITAAGHEVLSAGLPYTAAEIEALMSPRQ